uniref:Uncharacterized protein n=1 Tax=Mustela putorius furo TaxID=9669 RepID=M3XML5_MUSPF
RSVTLDTPSGKSPGAILQSSAVDGSPGPWSIRPRQGRKERRRKGGKKKGRPSSLQERRRGQTSITILAAKTKIWSLQRKLQAKRAGGSVLTGSQDEE